MYKPNPIREIDEQFRRTAVITGIILTAAATLLIWDSRDPFIWGFLLGGVFGIINARFLVNRMHMLAGLSQKQANMFMRHGFYFRMTLIIAVAYLASRTEALSLFGVGAGLLLTTVVTVVDAAIALRRYFAARDAVDRI